MSDLLLDVMNVVALNGYVQNIAKIRETCKEASQLEILNERFQAEKDILNYNASQIQKWWRKIDVRCRYCGDYYHIRNGLNICNDCYVYAQYDLQCQWEEEAAEMAEQLWEEEAAEMAEQLWELRKISGRY